MRTELAVLFAVAGCAGLPAVPTLDALTLRDMPGGAVAVVKIARPWYAVRPLVVNRFRGLVPEYQSLAGLDRKQFSFAENGAFGGVYTWAHRTDAEAWFSPEWHARVKQQRGVDGDVRLIDVEQGLEAARGRASFEGPMVVTIAKDTLDRYRDVKGLLSAYAGEGLVVSTWVDRPSADAHLAGRDEVEWFDTPVGLVNR